MKTLWIGIVPSLLLVLACNAAQTQENPLAAALKTSYEAETQQDYEGAIKALAIPAAAGSYIAQLRLGWLLYCSKNWDESVSHYKQAAKLAPFAVEPLQGLLLPQTAGGKNDDVMRTAQAILRLDPNNYTALSRTAWLLYLQKDYRQAAATYHKLVNLYPADTEMLLGLGFSLKLACERKESQQYFNTVLLLSPGNTRALEGLSEESAKPKAEAISTGIPRPPMRGAAGPAASHNRK